MSITPQNGWFETSPGEISGVERRETSPRNKKGDASRSSNAIALATLVTLGLMIVPLIIGLVWADFAIVIFAAYVVAYCYFLVKLHSMEPEEMSEVMRRGVQFELLPACIGLFFCLGYTLNQYHELNQLYESPGCAAGYEVNPNASPCEVVMMRLIEKWRMAGGARSRSHKGFDLRDSAGRHFNVELGLDHGMFVAAQEGEFVQATFWRGSIIQVSIPGYITDTIDHPGVVRGWLLLCMTVGGICLGVVAFVVLFRWWNSGPGSILQERSGSR